MGKTIFVIYLLNDWDECVKTWVASDEETAHKIKDTVENHVDKYNHTVYINRHNIFTCGDSFNPKDELGKLYCEKLETIFIPHTDMNNPKQNPEDMRDLFKDCKILETEPNCIEGDEL